jgi:hypothetical protein
MTNEQRNQLNGLIREHLKLIEETWLLKAVLNAAQQNHEIRDWDETYRALKDSPRFRDVEAQHARVLAAFEDKFLDEQFFELIAQMPPSGLPN